LYKRTRHVLSEALRVLEFREICLLNANSAIASTQTLQHLGRLMNESQESCATLFECSCPELDELTRLAREAGAYGSRLTGAGWGGCTVSLVAEDEVETFIHKISQSYPPYHGFTQNELHEVLFATRPSSGACGALLCYCSKNEANGCLQYLRSSEQVMQR
jgi:galactokinase